MVIYQKKAYESEKLNIKMSTKKQVDITIRCTIEEQKKTLNKRIDIDKLTSQVEKNKH
jgi:hypothetical protein